jgi:hypothetical protein
MTSFVDDFYVEGPNVLLRLDLAILGGKTTWSKVHLDIGPPGPADEYIRGRTHAFELTLPITFRTRLLDLCRFRYILRIDVAIQFTNNITMPYSSALRQVECGVAISPHLQYPCKCGDAVTEPGKLLLGKPGAEARFECRAAVN